MVKTANGPEVLCTPCFSEHSAMSHTQACDLQNQQVAHCFLLDEYVWGINVYKAPQRT